MMKGIWVALCVPALAAQIVPGKYIVELEGRPAAALAGGRRSGLALSRRSVQSRQEQVRPRLESLGARVLSALDTVANAFIVEIPDADAARLASQPGVAHVWPVSLMRLHLDHALPLLKVPDAWNLVGGMANAGAGVKIGVIDTGINQDHPAFQDSSLPMPPGFPLANLFSDLSFTTSKVIVVRNYVFNETPADFFGHGTAVAMGAAGVTNSGPLATITGVAPKAYLGNYKVSNGDTFDGSLLLTALEDAVNDGMDVINISSGISLAGRARQDPFVAAVEQASAMGTVVVLSAGNEGPYATTIASPATAPSAIAVGASENDRILAFAAVLLNGAAPWFGEPGNGPAPPASINGPLVDVAGLDGSGEACSALPSASLAGAIALIVRSPQTSGCTFQQKLRVAQSAGALAAIVYMNADSPALVIMDVGGATLPALSVDHSSGLAIRSHLLDAPTPKFTVQFSAASVPADPNRMADFSSRGPNLDQTIKPDLVATGDFLYTVTQSVNPTSFLYDATGYNPHAAGTSFSAPLVTGAVALVKAARPGLTADQYRSLIVNSATPLTTGGSTVSVQSAGAGLLNVLAAVQSTVAVAPVSLSFGTTSNSATLNITNLASGDDTLSISVVPSAGPPPALDNSRLQLAAGGTQQLNLRLPQALLLPGQYEGYVHIHGTRTSVDTVVPYWFGVSDLQPASLPILSAPVAAAAGSVQQVVFRVIDRAGVPLTGATPSARVLSGLGSVEGVVPQNFTSPGAFSVGVRLDTLRGVNVFEIDAGNASVQVSIEGN